MVASQIAAGGDGNLQAVDQVNITAASVLKNTEQWDKKTSLFNGGLTMTMQSDRQGLQTSTAQGSQIQSDGNLNIHAGSVGVIGSQLIAGQSASVVADTGDLVVAAAQNTSQSYNEHQKIKVDFFSDLLRPDKILQFKDGQIRLTIAEATYDKVHQTTDATTQTGAQILANQDVHLSASDDLTVTGSQVAADADADQQGDLTLAADNILIQEAKETQKTAQKEEHAKAEVSLVVQHQAVEVAKAALALQKSTKALKKAKDDYQQYKKQLTSLKSTLETLKSELAEKKPGVSQEDVTELADMIGDLKGDESWYVADIALAAEDVTSKTTLLLQQTGTSGPSAVTLGFNAGLHLDLDASKTSTDGQQTTSVASSLSGNNVTIQAGQAQGQSATIQGATVQATDKLAISGHEVNLLASTDQSNNTSSSESGHIGASLTVYGASSGVNLDASLSRDESRSQSQTHTNSSLGADHIQITSNGDTNVNGATVRADSQLDVSVGGDLNVASVQDRNSSNHKGQSISGGVSLSGGSMPEKGGLIQDINGAGDLNGANGGLNMSNGYQRSRQTVLTSLTSGGAANITVAGNTDLKGALIATTDVDGKDTGRLNMRTGTLTFSDLSNTTYSKNQSAGFSTGISLQSRNTTANKGSTDSGPVSQSATNVPASNPDGLKADATYNSSTLQYTNASGYQKTKTLATLGQGVLAIGDTAGSDDTTSLNRDVDNTQKDLFSVDRTQGDFDITVDHRLLSVTGRNEIAEDAKRTEITGGAIADVVTKDSVGLLGDAADGVDSVLQNIGNKQDFFTATKEFVTGSGNQALVKTLNDPNATEEDETGRNTGIVIQY
ncbi:hemagglutinin repeat-containing protein [Vibrio sp. PP-XX7]